MSSEQMPWSEAWRELRRKESYRYQGHDLRTSVSHIPQ